MKRSVRTTFIGLFIGLMAIVLLAVWAMNSFFLEKYYLNDKLNIPQDTYTPDQCIRNGKSCCRRRHYG